MKKIIVCILTIVILVIAAGIYLKFSGFNFSSLFKEQVIVIDKTANVVTEIHRLTELTTATYYGDYVIAKQRTNKVINISFLGQAITTTDELVLITKGKVRAGFDLSKLPEQDIIADSLSITLKLPEVQLLDIITNPSDFETFEENGAWSHDEVTNYKNEARKIIEKDALENGILELAEKSGKEKLTAFLQALGFQKVVIELNR